MHSLPILSTIVGDISGTVPIVISLRVDGTISINSNTLTTSQILLGLLNTDLGVNIARVDGFLQDGVLTEVGDFNQGTGETDLISFINSDVDVLLTVTRFVDDNDRTFAIGTQMFTIPLEGITLDFGSTAQLSISLPAGLSFISESGVLLSQAPSAVPEPSSLLLLSFGFGLAGLWQRCKGFAGTRH